MPIRVTCPGCGKLINAPDHAAGRTGTCNDCGTSIAIPTTTPEAPTPAFSEPPPVPMPPPPPASVASSASPSPEPLRAVWYSSPFALGGVFLLVSGVLWLLGTWYVASQELPTIMQELYVLLSWAGGFMVLGLGLITMLLDSIARSVMPPGSRRTKTSIKTILVVVLAAILIFVVAIALLAASARNAFLESRDSAPEILTIETDEEPPADRPGRQNLEELAVALVQDELRGRLLGVPKLVNTGEMEIREDGGRVFILGDVSHRRGSGVVTEPFAAVVVFDAAGNPDLDHLKVMEETLVGVP